MNKENQIAFFKIIQEKLPKNISLAQIVSELLGFGVNAAYVRIRGAKALDFEETIKLCRHFGVSLNSFIGNTAQNNRILGDYMPLYGNEDDFYFLFLRSLVRKLEYYTAKPGFKITVLSLGDIPSFAMSLFPDAAVFRYFSWCNLFEGTKDAYEKFVDKKLTSEVINDFNSVEKSYRQIPSSEIWSTNTIDTTLRFIGYHYEMGHFGDRNSALLLCDKFMELISTLERWATTGKKGDSGAALKLYLSEIDVGNTFILYKTDEEQECWLKLFTSHGITFTDKIFCEEVENWLSHSLQRATLVSRASSMERYKFFDAQRQKIEALAQRIKKN
ncbi:MAG: hypothetical protein LBV41_12055 [Cytophagaceae bacterium]|jgi:hypothetical protein|nr:hypothetical protein [Cytophagaceae bacterium]